MTNKRKMNRQEVFDKVVAHLAQQKEPSRDGPTHTAQCRYRNSKGLKCAIGFLIPDHLYSPHVEGTTPNTWQSVINHPDTFVNIKPYVEKIFKYFQEKLYKNVLKEHFLYDLQKCDDTYSIDVRELQDKLTRLAKTYNLNPKRVSKITVWKV